METKNSENTGNHKEEENLQKFFDEEQYSTLVLATAAEEEKQDDAVKDLLTLLKSRESLEKDATLAMIKKENATRLLINSIKKSKKPEDKMILVAACWESGLAFKGHCGFFMELALDTDPFVSMEAITVLEQNMEDILPEEVKPYMDKLAEVVAKGHTNAVLLSDLQYVLRERLQGE
jgi:hypothetical protein